MRLRGTLKQSAKNLSVNKKLEIESVIMDSDRLQKLLEIQKKKRYRSAFTTEQISYLEKRFKKCHYIGVVERREAAKALNMTERAVKIWFQNRRMKEKKKHGDDDANSHDMLVNGKANVHIANDNIVTVRPIYDQYSLPLNTSVNERNLKINEVVINDQCLMNSVTIGSQNVDTSYTSEHNHINIITPKVETETNTMTKKSSNIINKVSPKTDTERMCSNRVYYPKSHVKVALTQHAEQQRPNETRINQTVNKLKTENKFESSNDFPLGKPTSQPTYMTAPMPPGLYPFNVNPYYQLQQPVFNVLPEGSGPASLLGSYNIQPSLQRSCCNCDCHMKYPPVPMFVQNGSNSQYLLTAIPIQKANSEMS